MRLLVPLFKHHVQANIDITTQIMTATVAYDRSPSFIRYAPGQLTTFAALLCALDKADFSELRRPAPSAAVLSPVVDLVAERVGPYVTSQA